ncbi:MAG TPA: nucleoside-diphosphate sugar epimerase/dehydratase [bacterium]|nr:nucleoside-diphosphate sugar epimerase/dehydratase [bacterium]
MKWTLSNDRVQDMITPTVRVVFFLVGDLVLLLGSIVLVAWLRYDGRIPPETWAQLPLVALLSVAIKMPVFAWQRLYVLSWSQVGLEDMVVVFRGVTLATLLFWLAAFALRHTPLLAGFSRSILLLDYVISLYAIGAFRLARRVYLHLTHRASLGEARALIVGAGVVGEQLARSLRHGVGSEYAPVGFIDDSTSKIGTVIYGLPVLGDRARLPELVRTYRIDAVLIAMPSAPSRVIRNVVSLAREAGVREIRIVPGIDRMLHGEISFTDLTDVQLIDLLGRNVVSIDDTLVDAWLRDQTVLVTGAGGSIGTELCTQIARFHPREIVVVDWEETNLFWIHQELQRLGQRATAVLLDVRDAVRVRAMLAQHRPGIVFHAAAYKHVGLVEHHPEQAIFTNVLSSLVIATASRDAGVEKFVLISSDKAVAPTSVMGATKRVAEQICLALNAAGPTRYVAVRFGNVLGSRGSVVPIFQQRIRRGEPITVRGPEMRRYFMATSEAVLLVLQAGAMGAGGEIFALDMGEPIRVIDLAKELIRLSGLEPERDVPIIFADPEPGEKEHEDMLTAEEGMAATRHDRVFVVPGAVAADTTALFPLVDHLARCADAGDIAGIVRTLRALVPTYRPSELMLRRANVVSPLP